MPVFNKRIGFTACLIGMTALSLVLAGPASADTAARNGDAVGVGSDTLQNAGDFVLDGAPGVAGGYNNVTGNNHRIDNVFATGDANGRAVYDGTCGVAVSTTGVAPICSTSSVGNPNLLAGSVILRSGTHPVTRPNGSGAGVAALNADGTAGYQDLPTGSIQYARMSRLPKTTEEANCTNACGGLHVYAVATDILGLAHVATGYNGPVEGLSAQDLYHIYVDCTYTKWSDVPGYSGTAGTQLIDPLIPQAGSGTRNFFLADLNFVVNGSSTVPTPGCGRVVEEHDPTGVYDDPTPANAIEPFSQGKLALINGGTVVGSVTEAPYFSNPGYSGSLFAKGAFTPGYLSIDAQGQTAGDGNASYTSGSHQLYVTVRQSDVVSTTPFQVGGTKNFVQTFLTGGNSAVWTSGAAQSEIVAAGFTPAFKDCGLNPTTC